MNFTESTKRRALDLLRRRRAGLQWRFEMMRNRLFDIRYGVETHHVAALAEQGVSPAEAAQGNNIYRPIWNSEFRRLMRGLDVDPRQFTFVDLGSGKGKLMLLAARYGFAKVVGVEYAAGLHAVAIDNIEKFKKVSKRDAVITAINADARTFDLPQEPLVMLMFNPFGARIARAVVEHIENDHRRNPREMYLIYVNRRNVAEIGDAFADIRIFEQRKASREMLLFRAGGADGSAPSPA